MLHFLNLKVFNKRSWFLWTWQKRLAGIQDEIMKFGLEKQHINKKWLGLAYCLLYGVDLMLLVQTFAFEYFFIWVFLLKLVKWSAEGGGWAEGLRWQWANSVFTHFSDHWLFQPNSNKRPFWQGEPTVPQKGIVSLSTFMGGGGEGEKERG